MDDKTHALLLEIAGYLTMITNGLPASKTEAESILNKIGVMLAEDQPSPSLSD